MQVGCGGGLVGIKCLLENAQVVHFQDFNSSVLQYFTLPNIVLNLKSHLLLNSSPLVAQLEQRMLDILNQKCRFYSGDWSVVREEIETDREKYDRIFSCETIYNQSNYDKLVDLIKAALKPQGVAYIGAKCFYFGCDGGIQEFKSFADTHGLDVSSERIISIGLEREILKVTLKR